MANKYYQKDKERLRKKHKKDVKIFLEKKKKKGRKWSKIDIKIFLKKKNKNFVSV